MVRRDSADDGRAQFRDGGECRRGAAVLEDDAQVRERGVQGDEGGEEGGLCVEDGDGFCGRGGRGRVGGWRGGDFAVQVEDHVGFLHGGENGVEGLVVYYA